MQIIFSKGKNDTQKCQLIYHNKEYIGYGRSKDIDTAQRMALGNALSNLPEYYSHHLEYIVKKSNQ